MGKQKDYLAMETDAKFFDDMYEMEKRILMRIGDEEALKIIEDERRELEEEPDED